MQNLFDISGKVAVVTGGSRGIGAMIARGFVENGVKTYICSRDLAEASETAEVLSKAGTCIALQADLSTLDAIETFVAEISSREERIDILVNNAGAVWGAPIDDSHQEEPNRLALQHFQVVFVPRGVDQRRLVRKGGIERRYHLLVVLPGLVLG